MSLPVSAANLRLVFTTDQMPGYTRLRRGKRFSFRLPDGKPLSDEGERKRILSLAVPPAYQDVWICTLPNGHLQATGIDARGRKQYRYHPAWHEMAADKKFGLLRDFAIALPVIRARYRKEIALPELTRERVIAGVVALLDLTGYRIGNSRYARENRTYGLSSLLTRHLKDDGKQLILKFRGKAGQEHLAEISSPLLAKLVAELQELPGQHLFTYEDDLGQTHPIETSDVNGWLKEAGGGDFTAKQFRTWKASILFARELAAEPPAESMTARKQVVRQAISTTAGQLNHTVATCRKYYIHPALIDAYEDGSLHRIMNSRPPALSTKDGSSKLHADERRVFKILSMCPGSQRGIRLRSRKTPPPGMVVNG